MSDYPDLSGPFDPKQIESELYKDWEEHGYFAPSGKGTPFSLAIPPPNVTGSLHIGHAFQQTLMDATIRYRRMAGFDTLWQTGTDHAGISTQMVVTEQVRAEGEDPSNIGREAFVDRVWQWKKKSGGTITQQMRRMGASVDWSRERFTMDEGFSRAVTEVFVRLYEEGLIYKGTRLVNWDPKLKTALSDLEVISEDEQSHLWHLRYPLADAAITAEKSNYLVVATTRPETMLGDTAVAVNPDDKRYQHLVGKAVVLPLANRRIPIIADSHVDSEFGTGCLKITPGHDFDDNEIGTRHSLPSISIFTDSATMNESVPEPFQGMDRFDARERIVKELDELGLLERIEPYVVKIPRGERSKEIVEPTLTNQWFVNIAPLAERAIRAVEDGKIKFQPRRWENVYFSWMRNIRDWCISRQLWWGHRIPAWYDSSDNIYVGRTEEEARINGNLSPTTPLRRDRDVLETWFSSALWTFATLGWPDKTDELRKYHPTDVLVTGHDIIFFWVARMIMMTLHFTDEVPFHKVYIHGLIRDAEGNKMSKTAGNGLDPLDVVDGIDLESLVEKRTKDLPQPRMAARIEKATRRDYPKGIRAYGADSLRFTYCAIASPGSNYNFDISRVEGYHFFCNKLWNATKYVLFSCQDLDLTAPYEPSIADRWIRSQMGDFLKECKDGFESYRFDLCAKNIFQFVWHEYCDWYIELTKPAIYFDRSSPAIENSAKRTLAEMLELVLRAIHPVIPFITDSLWKRVGALVQRTAPSLLVENYPRPEDYPKDLEADAAIGWLKGIVNAIRNIRGERQISPKNEIRLILSGGMALDRVYFDLTHLLLTKLTRTKEVAWHSEGKLLPPGSVQVVGDLQVNIPFEDEAEISDERSRIEKEIARIERELDAVANKLQNKNFVERAPENIVNKQREKESLLQSHRNTLSDQIKQLSNLDSN